MLRIESTVDIFVKPSNDPPIIAMSVIREKPFNLFDNITNNSLQCLRNTACPLKLIGRDIDAMETVGGLLHFTLSAMHGTFSWDKTKSVTGTFSLSTVLHSDRCLQFVGKSN